MLLSAFPLTWAAFHSVLEQQKGCVLEQNYRMGWAGKDLKDHLIPNPCHGQGHPPLNQVTQSPMQPGFELKQNSFSNSHLDSLGSLLQRFTALRTRQSVSLSF